MIEDDAVQHHLLLAVPIPRIIPDNNTRVIGCLWATISNLVIVIDNTYPNHPGLILQACFNYNISLDKKNHINYKLWDEITFLFQSFTSAAI